jgi:endonuclease YncB( thermonuclease family)
MRRERVIPVLVCLLVGCAPETPAHEGMSRNRDERAAGRLAGNAESGRGRDGVAGHRNGVAGHRAGRTGGRAARRGQPSRRTREALVARVVDGDTIEVERPGVSVVRLIGVDTPETVAPGAPVECYGRAASAFTRRSLLGDHVRLEYDVERTDRYGRTLAYVWEGATLFNRLLVRRGFATVATYPPNVAYESRFIAAEKRARNQDRGLWGACAARAASGRPSGRMPRTGGGRCDPNYAGACVPRYPPDLDCGDVPTGFRSVGADPHGFDADGDGIACEG